MNEEGKELREDIIFVKGTTETKGLATCIFATATKDGKEQVKMRGIGHGAIGQMSKAYIIAKGKLSEKGIKATLDMYFKDIPSKREGENNITALEFLIKFDR